MKPIKVAIVEDNREIREGLTLLINGSPDFQCVLACASAEAALIEIPRQQPDVVLMDIGLPGISGIECIRRLKELAPKTQMMMLTVFEDHDKIFQSLAVGASGYLIKRTPPAKVLEAIQELHHGGSPMSNQIARRVVQVFQTPVRSSEAVALLSEREQEILTHLAQGFLYKEIAEALGISTDTVRTHVRNIYEKLHVHTRTGALLKAFPKF
jgi:DNA-binding NarL/FixJ family response regulator